MYLSITVKQAQVHPRMCYTCIYYFNTRNKILVLHIIIKAIEPFNPAKPNLLGFLWRRYLVAACAFMVALWSRNWKGKILCTSQIINDSPTG
jgi:hypothetical protein